MEMLNPLKTMLVRRSSQGIKRAYDSLLCFFTVPGVVTVIVDYESFSSAIIMPVH
jgi:hypothetical protein